MTKKNEAYCWALVAAMIIWAMLKSDNLPLWGEIALNIANVVLFYYYTRLVLKDTFGW